MKQPCLKALIFLATGLGLVSCGDSNRQRLADNSAGIVRLGDTPVADVNGSLIYDTDIDRSAAEQGLVRVGESLPVNDPAYSGLLDQLIDQRLLALRAKNEGLDNTLEAKRRIAVIEEQVLGDMVVAEHLGATVTEDEARKLYAAQMALRSTGDEVRASHILVSSKLEAEEVAKRLDGGESFAALAYDVSIDQGTRTDGGDLGYFQAGVMVEAFSTIVFALSPGETSPPFESEYGWHVVKLVDRRPAPEISFEDMRAEIINYMTLDQIKSLLTELRQEAVVDILVPSGPDMHTVDDVVQEQETP